MRGLNSGRHSLNIMKNFLKPWLCLAVVGISLNAAAAEGNAAFVRAELGSSFLNSGASENTELTYAARAGYFFNEHFGLEGSYSNLGEGESINIHVRHSSYGIGMVGKKSFGSDAHTGAFIDGRLGIARNAVKVSGEGLVAFKSEDNTPYVGIGVGYDFNRNFGVGLSILHQRNVEASAAEIDYSTVTLGVEYRF